MSVNGNQRNNGSDPIVKAHFIRFLKNRKRLVDKGIRKDILQRLQEDMESRRTPGTVAKKVSSTAVDRASGPVKDTASNKMEQILTNANRGPIEHI